MLRKCLLYSTCTTVQPSLASQTLSVLQHRLLSVCCIGGSILKAIGAAEQKVSGFARLSTTTETYRAVFLVVAASVLALASRMDHHWYFKVGLPSIGCRTVHGTSLLASKLISVCHGVTSY